ncbi:SHOCT domain-containing protein [Thalassotalea sp. PLHSN55]|uniref:SHOCT domain-containing protein n=1 Tax=Thalassotalea sp. PLHSN55 TaxID=3435888 RepID=UPI003F836132
MRIHGTSKTKESKYNSTVGLIISIGMLVVALMVFDFSNMPAFGKIFMIFWVFAVCAQIYQSYRNSIFSNKSLHHEVTDHSLKVSGGAKSTAPKQQDGNVSHAMRLRQIEQLYREGLLTTDEYEAKRQDVLDEDWGK